ncbi:molecular chaperone DnaJ [Salmonella enterica]|nr:molecular chaperone DnaJ [Salmonella enterica]
MANPDCCPHCGGVNGVHTKEIVDYKSFYDWDGTYGGGEHNRSIRGGMAYYCCDCGRNVTKLMETIGSKDA